ncbi:hypothetical protein SPD48_03850 [Pseudogracilibacillus sp. SE30717A]
MISVYQKKGIGGRLIRAATKKAKEMGLHSIFFYDYPKFGFKPASFW